ncbi:MAG: glycosyltransferase [Roseburia sp.]
MEEYKELFAGVERLKEMGGVQEALQLLLIMKQKLPDKASEIQLEILKIKFQQGLYQETFDEALGYLPEDDGRILQWLLEKYYEPFRSEYEKIKNNNTEYLEKYVYFYGIAKEYETKILWYDGREKIFFCKEKNVFSYYSVPEIEMKSGTVPLIINMLNIEQLIEQKNKTKYIGTVPNYEVPIYLYYDEDIFAALIQCVEFRELLEGNRVVIIVGEDNLNRFFGENQVKFPHRIIGHEIEKVKIALDNQDRRKTEKMRCDKAQIEEYYSKSETQINERIRRKKPRVLFVTSYFTTVLQYHTRDCKKALEKMGIDTEILIERANIFRISSNDFYSCINSFRPDVVFVIDHFRFEHWECPKEIMWVCWVQDPLEHIMDKETPGKLGDRDFVMNHFTSWSEFKRVGYDPEKVLEAPVPADASIYKKQKMTAKEYSTYSCDICLVCHAADVKGHIETIMEQFPEELREAIAAVYYGYKDYVYKTGEFFYSKEFFAQYVDGVFRKGFEVVILPQVLEYIAEDMYLEFNQKVFRQTIVDWLIEAGYTNIKLWGKGWLSEKKYEKYAMGVAENGKTLSKILQSSKIVLGNNVNGTGAARAWETMLSGSFYISNYIPPEEDFVNIRKIMTEGENLVMFHSKQDLLNKVDYYLNHEEERKQMAEKGTKLALQYMTFDALMQKMLCFLSKKIEGKEQN